MFGIEELNIKILVCCDIKTLNNICFLNKTLNNIIFNNEKFWKDKFIRDDLPILDNFPSFQQYIKILDCKDKAEKILLINDTEYHDKKYQHANGKIAIVFDINMLPKLLPDYVEEFNDYIKEKKINGS